MQRFTDLLPLERMHGAWSNGTIVGGAGAFPFNLTVPGGELPTAGVTVVGVLPTHRRRGVLRSLMRAQLDDAHERGEPLAALWASEESIYGRFGYGLASFCGEITLAHEYTVVRAPVRAAGDAAADRARRGAGSDPAGLRAHPARVARHVLAEQPPGGRTARSPIPKNGVTARARSAGSHTNATGRSRATPSTGTSRASKQARRTRSCESSRRWARRRKRCATSGPTCSRSTGSRPSSPICCRPTIHCSCCWRLHGACATGWATESGSGSSTSGRRSRAGPIRATASIVFDVADEFCPWNEGRWKLDGGRAERSQGRSRAVAARAVARLGAARRRLVRRAPARGPGRRAESRRDRAGGRALPLGPPSVVPGDLLTCAPRLDWPLHQGG